MEISKEEFYEKYGYIYVKFTIYDIDTFHFINDDDDNDNLHIFIEIKNKPENIKDLVFSIYNPCTINFLKPQSALVYDNYKLLHIYKDS